METSIKNILIEISKEYNLDYSVIQPIITRLNKEFYFKLKDIKNLSKETWKSFNLPLNLFYLLNEKYQKYQNNNNNNIQFNPQKQISNNNFNKIQNNLNNNNLYNKYNNYNNYNNNYNNYNNNYKYNNNSNNYSKSLIQNNNNTFNYQKSSQSNVINRENIQKYLQSIFMQINNFNISKDVFHLLFKIINNIIKNPNNEKYKKINIQKLFYLYNYSSLKQFLFFIGFKQLDNNYLYLIGSPSNLNIVNPELNLFIKNNKLAQIDFNPYKSSFTSLSNNENQIKKISSFETNFEDLIIEEKRRRRDIVLNTKVYRNPKFYTLTQKYGMNRLLQTMSEKDDDLIYKSIDESLIYKNSMELIKKNANNRFILRSRTEYEKLINKPIYVKSEIRLKFPDQNILEGSFALYETIGDIYNFIREYLYNKYEQFTISTTPPPKKYINLNEKIAFYKLFPQVLMYVNFERYSGLNRDKVNKIRVFME